MRVLKELADYTADVVDFEKTVEMLQKKVVDEAEIENVHFDMGLNKEYFKIFMVMMAMCVLLGIRVLLPSILYSDKIELSLVQIVFLILLARLFLMPIILRLKPVPSVHGNILSYRGKNYHYSQISNVTISKTYYIKVYSNGKRLFGITKDSAGNNSDYNSIVSCLIGLMIPFSLTSVP